MPRLISSSIATPAQDRVGLSPANRSLERGIEILRSFRPGSELLGNAEIAERTGLAPSTVSRLTQTLVGCGYLQVDARTRAYSLAPAVLSVAHAMRTGSTVLNLVAPRMLEAARAEQVNVGLASRDRDEMVYLESIRYNRRPSLRKVVSGQRVPIELTSLGRVYLACAPEKQRKALFSHFRKTRGKQWAVLEPVLLAAIRSVDEEGYCAAAWQHEVVAVAAPLAYKGTLYSLNMSLSTSEPTASVVREIAPKLLALRERLQHELDNAATE